jgi:hypothetical protein
MSIISKLLMAKSINLNVKMMDILCMASQDPISCPYCESKFSDSKELSKHIDRIHTGSGLLEGDTRRL